ncbi:keratin, type I cytoskeletal 18 isoform X1 [Osmerus eperlanus]|uniref:keratin, type I cytoskeletal 18 isoform X1 n=1 Tax=Osmerus eperlanus TaxID=29151 RepID=UPI002E13DF4D
MARNSAGSMFGGAGGRGSRVSVASLEGLRNVMRADPEKKPATNGPISSANGPVVAAAAPDDKKTMRGLNDRLNDYLGRVRQLESSNTNLEEQIKDILAKRAVPVGRDWVEIEKPVADLRKKLRDKTLDNARLLLQIDNTKLANEDFKNKLESEKQAKKVVEHDLVGLKKVIDDTLLNKAQLESQIESIKQELAFLKKDHSDEVVALRKKVKDSEVIVEIDSNNSNLGDVLDKMRKQYDKLAKKNLKDTDDWYQSKFDNIKVEVAQNTEALQYGKQELNDLRRQRQLLEIDTQAMLNMIRSLEDTLSDTQRRYNNEISRINKILLQLEADLTKVRSQVERQVEDYQDLLHVKMKLEAEIENYQRLILGISDDKEASLEFSLENALNSAPPKSSKKGEKEKEEEKMTVKVVVTAPEPSVPATEPPPAKVEAPPTQKEGKKGKK